METRLETEAREQAGPRLVPTPRQALAGRVGSMEAQAAVAAALRAKEQVAKIRATDRQRVADRGRVARRAPVDRTPVARRETLAQREAAALRGQVAGRGQVPGRAPVDR